MIEERVDMGVRHELDDAEQQAAELWRQAEQVCAAYRAATERADQLREQLRRSGQHDESHEYRRGLRAPSTLKRVQVQC